MSQTPLLTQVFISVVIVIERKKLKNNKNVFRLMGFLQEKCSHQDANLEWWTDGHAGRADKVVDRVAYGVTDKVVEKTKNRLTDQLSDRQTNH